MENITAGQVATELRRIADAFDKEPDIEVKRPMLAFWPETKEQFLTLARHLPRPLHKKIEGEDGRYQKYILQNQESAVWTHVSIDRNELCILVEPARPARYECPSILSAEEEAALGQF